MNGTRGIIRATVYRKGGRPDHVLPTKRLPDVLLVECAEYAGEPFFDKKAHPERAKWVPFFPRELSLEDDDTIARTQLSVVLAWALTPWKAQGMSMEKVVVKIGGAASRPGVAFTTLTRARHPDGLAIDDDFPVMSAFQKQRQHKTFQKRLHFERVARVRFSETLRAHMRDSELYGPTNAWSAQEAAVADDLLTYLQADPACPSTEVVERAMAASATGDVQLDTYCDVFRRLETEFPHMFAVAAARGNLDSLTLSGHNESALRGDSETMEITVRDWSVPAAEIA